MPSGVIVVGGRDPVTEAVERRLAAERGSSSVSSWTEASAIPRRPTSSDGPETAVYLASSRGTARARPDLADARTVFDGLTAAGSSRLVVVSSAAAIAPSYRHPGLAGEDVAPSPRFTNSVAADWRELERLARNAESSGAIRHLAVLRPAGVATREKMDPMGQLFAGRVVFTAAGHDPTIQVLDIDDLAEAICRTAGGDAEGLFHVAPASVIPLHRALDVLDATRIPLPHWLLRSARRLLAALGRRSEPDELEYLRYPWTVSGERMARELGFVPKRSSRRALEVLAGATGPEPVGGDGTDDGRGEFDPFGMDVGYIRTYGRTLFRFLHDVYWRIELRGVDRVPTDGPAVLVGMHRGFMPWDGVMALHGIARQHRRHVRFLIHPALTKFPFLFNFMRKLGGVPANADNADLLLRQGELLGVFPEGIRGAFTLYRDAYRLGSFGRDDYVRMALRNRVPIVPFVTVGSAETFPILGKIESRRWTRYSEWPFLPLTPTFPLLPVPLPSKWHTWFLEPIHVERDHPPEAAEDRSLVAELSERIRGRMQEAIDEMLDRRPSIFFGSIFDGDAARDDRVDAGRSEAS